MVKNVKRILLVSSHPLFARGISNLLKDEADLQIVGIAKTTAEARQMLAHFTPEIIIVERDDKKIQAQDFIVLLSDYHELRVIMVTLDDERMEVYRREQIIQTGLEGLKEAIKK